MSDKEVRINMTSSLAEKGVDAGVDAARSFLGKLIMPAVEEVGLLMKDKITVWRLNNQVKMLNRAKAICEKHNINPKSISLKLVVPLLEGAGLEEDEVLRDKWANLLSNLVDSEQSIENHVFPYILGQLSRNEFEAIEEFFNEYDKRRKHILHLIKETRNRKAKRIPEINHRLNEIRNEMLARREETNNKMPDTVLITLIEEKDLLNKEQESFDPEIRKLEAELDAPIRIPKGELEGYELSNLTRLGLIKEQVDYYAYTKTVESPQARSIFNSLPEPNVQVDLDSNSWYLITELGEMFVKACKEKRKLV